jgi:hypothetical protein
VPEVRIIVHREGEKVEIEPQTEAETAVASAGIDTEETNQ